VIYSAVRTLQRSLPADDPPEPSSLAPNLDALPALVLFGRCCVLLADIWSGLVVASGSLDQVQLRLWGQFFDNFRRQCHLVFGWLGWFGPPLLAAGYPVGPLQQHAQALFAAAVAAYPAVPCVLAPSFSGALDPVAATAAAAAIRELVQRLRAVGAAAGAIPVGSFCNNSGCVNVCGPSEVMLVSGRTNLCAGCRTARYCGRGCQRQAWKQHKPVCKALAAAAAAAAGAHDAEGAGAAT
jgi:hypothetical protein